MIKIIEHISVEMKALLACSWVGSIWSIQIQTIPPVLTWFGLILSATASGFVIYRNYLEIKKMKK